MSVERAHVSRSAEPISLHSVPQVKKNAKGVGKPCGLWYEVDDDWCRWRADEDWGISDDEYHFAVELGSASVLVIDTLDKLDSFHRQHFADTAAITDWKRLLRGVDWERVARKYDGIEIAPYRWERRLMPEPEWLWYYGWDCASGVIWRPRQDTRLTYIGRTDIAHKREDDDGECDEGRPGTALARRAVSGREVRDSVAVSSAQLAPVR